MAVSYGCQTKNVKRLSQKLPSNVFQKNTNFIDTELCRQNVHIAALQETRLAGAGTIKERNFTFFWFGKPADEPRLYGTGFAVKNTIVNSIQTPFAVSDRISVMKHQP